MNKSNELFATTLQCATSILGRNLQICTLLLMKLHSLCERSQFIFINQILFLHYMVRMLISYINIYTHKGERTYVDLLQTCFLQIEWLFLVTFFSPYDNICYCLWQGFCNFFKHLIAFEKGFFFKKKANTKV